MVRPPPGSTSTDTHLPYPPLFRTIQAVARGENVPNATGAVLGGIVGAVAGHEISDKTGGSKGNQNIAAAAGAVGGAIAGNAIQNRVQRSDEHTSELQSLMRISYAVFCLKKKNEKTIHSTTDI